MNESVKEDSVLNDHCAQISRAVDRLTEINSQLNAVKSYLLGTNDREVDITPTNSLITDAVGKLREIEARTTALHDEISETYDLVDWFKSL